MESSRKLEANLVHRVGKFLDHYLSTSRPRLCVAVSGGLDSIALLFICHQLRSTHHFELSALHINHQLQPINRSMEEWVQHCCRQWSIPLTVYPVKVNLESGLGPENAAREARYQVFKKHDTDYLLLAHHANDQAETVLSQLFRGAGLPGLSAMPQQRRLPDSHVCLLRPLLNTTRAELTRFTEEYQLEFVEDPSNSDDYYVRNYIRHSLAPLIEKKVPQWVAVLNRSASHFAKAQELLDELAQIDLEHCQHVEALDGDKVLSLGESRAANLLRYWLTRQQLPVPHQAQWLAWWQQVEGQSSESHPRLDLGEVSLVSDQGYWSIASSHRHWQPRKIDGIPQAEIEIPGVGILSCMRVQGEGIRESVFMESLLLRPRLGGERFRYVANRPHKEVKKLFQELDIPLWQRELWPMLVSGDRLIAIPNIGVSLEEQALENEWGIKLSWRFIHEHGQGGAKHDKI